jgi:hypothetical protein
VTGAGRAARRTTMRRRRATAAVAGVLVVATAAYGLSRLGAAAGRDPDRGSREEVPAEPSELLVLQVTSTADPLIAVIGAGGRERRAAFFTVPFDLMLTVPGQGETPAVDVAGLGAETVRVAVSNTLGVWAEHVAVLDLGELSGAVDRGGDLRVDVPGFYVTEAGNLGPGPSRLSGEQVVALLAVAAEGGEARWASVVQALLRRPVRLGAADLAETDGLAGVRRVLAAARGAGVASFPTQSVAGSVTVALQPDLDREVRRVFGYATPVPVIVQNGVGAAGLGEDVATQLLPLGFRVVLSQNAEPFGYERTRVVANDDAAVADARRIREALGVGRVGVSRVPSGIGEITIIVGEDFTG